MGWSSGSLVFCSVIKAAKKFIKDDAERRKFYLMTLPDFDGLDWDTQGECEGKDEVFDKILHDNGYIENEEEDE